MTFLFIAAIWNEEIQVRLSHIQLNVEYMTLDNCIKSR